jgi:hypothetical protein
MRNSASQERWATAIAIKSSAAQSNHRPTLGFFEDRLFSIVAGRFNVTG